MDWFVTRVMGLVLRQRLCCLGQVAFVRSWVVELLVLYISYLEKVSNTAFIFLTFVNLFFGRVVMSSLGVSLRITKQINPTHFRGVAAVANATVLTPLQWSAYL